jgi:hypothetical protein
LPVKNSIDNPFVNMATLIQSGVGCKRKGSAMRMKLLNHRIEALLDDPLVSLMIQADGVDRSDLARRLGALGRKVADRGPSDKKPKQGWRALSFDLCGACAS